MVTLARFFDFIRPGLRPDEVARSVARRRPGPAGVLRPAPTNAMLRGRRSVAEPHRPDLVRAALLHDVGKRHANLGAVGRVLATLAIRLRLPLTPRWRLYRDHGRLAAAELGDEEPVVIEFARHHQIGRPPTIPAADWDILASADRARLHVGRRDR